VSESVVEGGELWRVWVVGDGEKGGRKKQRGGRKDKRMRTRKGRGEHIIS
jgi:hypothetical protein